MNKVTMLFISAKSISALNKSDKSIIDDFWNDVKANDLQSVYKKYPKGADSNGFYAVETKESTKFFKAWNETFETALNGDSKQDSSIFDAQLALLASLPKSAAVTKMIKELKAAQK